MEKLFYVYQIIKNTDKPIPARQIKEELKNYQIEVDIKTIYQCIDKINIFFQLLNGNKCIETIHRKGYIIEEEYFDDGQLRFLLDSILSNENLNKEDQDNLISQLLKLSSSSQQKRIVSFNHHTNNNPSLLLTLTTILTAINQKKNIYFQYIDYKVKDNQLVEVPSKHGNLLLQEGHYYVVSPYQVMLHGGHYYLMGYYDERKDQLSIYRLDRMRIVRKHQSKFIEIREQFNMEKEFQQMIYMHTSNEKINLTFRFDSTIIREVVNQFGNDIQVSMEYDGWIKASMKEVSNTRGLRGWILMLQDHIEILEPVELKEEIIKTLENMQGLYYK